MARAAPKDVKDEEQDGPSSDGPGRAEPSERDDAGAQPSEADKKPDGPRGGSYAFLGGVSLVSLVSDLASKEWVTNNLGDPHGPLSGRLEVIKERLVFISAKNPGGAWGIFGQMPDWFRKGFFLCVSVGAVFFILSLWRKLEPGQRLLKWGLPLVLGGALGNFVDRIRYGHVVDFIDVRLTSSFHWPTFNVADIAIVVGVGLMALDMFAAKKPEVRTPAVPPQDPHAVGGRERRRRA